MNNRGEKENWNGNLLVSPALAAGPLQRLDGRGLLQLTHPRPHGESMKQLLRRGGLPAGRQPHFCHLGGVFPCLGERICCWAMARTRIIKDYI